MRVNDAGTAGHNDENHDSMVTDPDAMSYSLWMCGSPGSVQTRPNLSRGLGGTDDHRGCLFGGSSALRVSDQ